MSRRDDYILALSIVVLKDQEVTVGQAGMVSELAMGLPPDSFPVVTAQGLREFIDHAIEPWCRDAPAWLVEARENVKLTSALIKVRACFEGANHAWCRNANLTWEPHDTPASTHALIKHGETSLLTPEDYGALLAWVKSVPGDDDAQPFQVVEEDE